MTRNPSQNTERGLYSTAYPLIDFATVPVSSIQAAAIPQLFQRGTKSLKSAEELSRRLLKRALPLTLALAAVMFLMAPMIRLVMGWQFVESSLALRWLCRIPVFRRVQILSGAALLGAGYQTQLTCAQVIAAGANFLFEPVVDTGLGLAWGGLVQQVERTSRPAEPTCLGTLAS